MTPTDLELAQLELDTYSITPKGEVYDCGNDRAVITRLPDCTVISFMGTNNAADWVSNFKILGVAPLTDPMIGDCESGFLAGASNLWTILEPHLGKLPVIVQGHSRGAGMVPIFAAFMVLSRNPSPLRCVCWEAPWAVGQQCKDILLGEGIDGVQFWHGDDIVPCIPAVPWLVPNVWPIKHFGSWKINPFDCHAMAGIVAELAVGIV